MIITEEEKYEILNKYGINNILKENLSNEGFFMYFAFPAYRASLEDNWLNRILRQYGKNLEYWEDKLFTEQKKMIKIYKTGHGGCIIVDKSGDAKMFEFGPYDEKGKGQVHQVDLGKIAQFDKNHKLVNAPEIAKMARSNTFGDGPTLKMIVSLLSLPNVTGALNEAKKPRSYSLIDILGGGSSNCGTFAIEVAQKGGIRDVTIGFLPEKPITIYKKFNQSKFRIYSFEI